MFATAMEARAVSRLTSAVCWAGVILAGIVVAQAGGGESGARRAHEATAELLTPGAQVRGPRTLPRGWTHLVIKSVPRLSSGDLGTLPDIARTTATTFRTVMLAEVRRERGTEGRFVLRRIGLGLATPIDGVDTVVSSATVDQLHAPLGIVARVVLGKAEEELARGTIQARTPTFALYSTPALQKIGSVHVPVFLKYALLVEPRSGTLQTLLWSEAADAERRVAPERVALLPPDLVNDTAVDVKAKRVLSAIPVDWSFAMAALPSGKLLPTTPAVRRSSLRETFTPAEAAGFEKELHALLNAGGSGK